MTSMEPRNMENKVVVRYQASSSLCGVVSDLSSVYSPEEVAEIKELSLESREIAELCRAILEVDDGDHTLMTTT